MSTLITLLEKNRDLSRPAHMLNDELMSGLTWENLESAWLTLASEPNQALVPEFVTALWKASLFLPQSPPLGWVLTATVLLAGPACFPASSEAPMS